MKLSRILSAAGTLALSFGLVAGLTATPALASISHKVVVLEIAGYHGMHPVVKNVGIAPKSFNIMYGGPFVYATGMHWKITRTTATGTGTLWA